MENYKFIERLYNKSICAHLEFLQKFKTSEYYRIICFALPSFITSRFTVDYFLFFNSYSFMYSCAYF